MEEIKKEITWQAPEFKYHYKDISWYWLSVIAAAILFLAAIWQKNLLFAIFVIIAETTLIFWAKKLPRGLNFKIDKKGIHIDKIKFYTYDDLIGFHILEENDIGQLILKTKKKLSPFVKILLESGDIPKIKEFLKQYLEEIEYEESLTDHIEKIIRF
jgi:hypothetical protein